MSTVNARRILPLLKKPATNRVPSYEDIKELTPPEIIVHCKNAPDSPRWTLRVFSNKYLALTGEGGVEQETKVLYDKINDIPHIEAVIESPDHHTELKL
jgi:galactose-1-phosphate uridylyltransferase